ncbi:RNA polymerase sigma-70 factor [Pedobacter sp.]|uniref:RNA polymerase sigma-70 factor n=1 Tax=Pedobacter sp. TaxID=1411316 RepID=UPI003D7F930B
MQTQLPDLSHLVNQISLYNSQQAYKELFKYLYPALFSFSFSLLKSREPAEEVANDVLISLWRNRKSLLTIRNIKIYSFVMARNRSLNVINSDKKHQLLAIDDLEIEMVLSDLDPEQSLINGELKEKLQDAINSLPKQCKMVFKLIKEDGCSYKETASILNISTKTVDAHLVTAVKKLTVLLQLEYKLK